MNKKGLTKTNNQLIISNLQQAKNFFVNHKLTKNYCFITNAGATLSDFLRI